MNFLSLSQSQNKLAIDLGIPASRIDQIGKGKRSITADTAFRLSLYFGNSAEFWMNLQPCWDLETERDSYPAFPDPLPKLGQLAFAADGMQKIGLRLTWSEIGNPFHRELKTAVRFYPFEI